MTAVSCTLKSISQTYNTAVLMTDNMWFGTLLNESLSECVHVYERLKSYIALQASIICSVTFACDAAADCPVGYDRVAPLDYLAALLAPTVGGRSIPNLNRTKQR